jgi:hypothetical protein
VLSAELRTNRSYMFIVLGQAAIRFRVSRHLADAMPGGIEGRPTARNLFRWVNVRFCESRSDLGRAMNEDSEFVMAMTAIAFAAAMLVTGLLYMEKTSMQLSPALAAQVTSGEAALP